MPTSYWIDLEHKIVVSRAWGVLTDAEMREHHRELAADPFYDGAFLHLSDVRLVTRLVAGTESAGLGAWAWRCLAGQRRAIVTATDEQFGLARLFASYAETVGGIVEVFRSWTAAVMWLDTDPTPVCRSLIGSTATSA
jgi:hypothetical protein